MTRFKEYVRKNHGVFLECDFRALGVNLNECGTDCIIAYPEEAKVLKHHKISGWCEIKFHQDGRFTISHADDKTVFSAINRNKPWWDCIDEDEIAACF